MAPRFAARAKAAADQEAADRFWEITRDEYRHRDMFSLALQRSQAGV